MSDAYALTAASLDPPRIDAPLEALHTEIVRRYGDAIDAILVYGSYLRGTTDTIPDFYVLLRALPTRPRADWLFGMMIAPNVYYVAAGDHRAKVAVMTTAQLERGVVLAFAPYFWARFAQPCRTLSVRDAAMRARLHAILAQSATQLVRRYQDSWPSAPSSEAFWIATFRETYAAELRSERESRFAELYEANRAYYDALVSALPWRACEPLARARLVARRAVGKAASFARLLKSAATFEDPVGYMVWKLERHSGVHVEPTERERRYPFIFGWGLVWRLYRKGAFR